MSWKARFSSDRCDASPLHTYLTHWGHLVDRLHCELKGALYRSFVAGRYGHHCMPEPGFGRYQSYTEKILLFFVSIVCKHTLQCTCTCNVVQCTVCRHNLYFYCKSRKFCLQQLLQILWPFEIHARVMIHEYCMYSTEWWQQYFCNSQKFLDNGYHQ